MNDKQKPPRESWEGLQHGLQYTADSVPASDTPEELVWRALSAGTGKDLLDWLHGEYIEKRNRPGDTEAQLREAEAQRQLVSRLERMRDRGREIASARVREK